jgi:hypothetical protein
LHPYQYEDELYRALLKSVQKDMTHLTHNLAREMHTRDLQWMVFLSAETTDLEICDWTSWLKQPCS